MKVNTITDSYSGSVPYLDEVCNMLSMSRRVLGQFQKKPLAAKELLFIEKASPSCASS